MSILITQKPTSIPTYIYNNNQSCIISLSLSLSQNQKMLTSSSSQDTSLHLLTLLLKCAHHISTNNLTSATDLLPEILHLSTPFGSPADRVAAFFATSLQSHLLRLHFLFPPPPPPLKTLTLSSQLTSFHSALQSYNSLTPFIKFSHFTANQAIFDALNGHDYLHVIDMDVMQGLQWPGLFHILVSRTSNNNNKVIKSLRLTGFGPSYELLKQTGSRLAEFASSLGLPFHFNPIQGKIGDLSEFELSRLGVRPCEVTVVHCMHHNLYDISGSDVGTLRVLSAVRPRLVTIVEQDIEANQTASFLERFVEALNYYSALFDALGEGLSKDSVQRHEVEHQLFGSEIRNILAVGCRKINRDDDGVVSWWGHELVRVGFESFSLSGSPAAQASLLLEMFPWKGYTLMEQNGCLRLGWKELPLLTASAWQPCD